MSAPTPAQDGDGFTPGPWVDIATAPQDGTTILVTGCSYGPSVRTAQWGSGRYLGKTKGYDRTWVDYPGHSCDPLFWMPLPCGIERAALSKATGGARV